MKNQAKAWYFLYLFKISSWWESDIFMFSKIYIKIHTNVLSHITMKIIQLGKKSLFLCMYKVVIYIREGNNSVGGKMWFLKNLSYIFNLDPYLSNTKFHAYSSGNKGYETSLYYLILPVDLIYVIENTVSYLLLPNIYLPFCPFYFCHLFACLLVLLLFFIILCFLERRYNWRIWKFCVELNS